MKKSICFILLLACFISVQINDSKAQNSVSIARDQFDKFNNVKNGWLAGDATISLLLPDGKTLWLFGDSFIGEKSGEFSIDASNSSFINNCAILKDDTSLTAYYGGTIDNPSSLIPGEGNDIFWPEHATIENDTIKILAVRVIYEDNNTAGFNFRTGTTHLAQFTYPEMEHISTQEVDFIADSTIRFGAHILERNDYTYIFGVKDTTADDMTWSIPVLARYENSISEPWEFYAGSGNWSYNYEDLRTIGDRPMSESFFVYEKNDKFYLIMHEIWTVGELYILEADNITGPFNRDLTGGVENLFCIIPPHGSNFTYNLFAHPQFQNQDSILISFNVNTSNFSSIYTDTKNYRARFLWLSVDDAVSTAIPDTVYIFDDYTDDMVNSTNDLKTNAQQLDYYGGNIYAKNINEPSVLDIFSIEGKKYLSEKLNEDKVINIDNLPNKILIIQLVNKTGIITKKILHH